MADHAENSSSGRVARGTPSRRRASTPFTPSDATQPADAQPGEPRGEATLDLFGDGHAPVPLPESADAAQGMSAEADSATAAPGARRGGRAKPAAAMPAEDAAGLSVEPAGHADAPADGAAPEYGAAMPRELADPDGSNAEAAQADVPPAAIAPEVPHTIEHSGEAASAHSGDTGPTQPEARGVPEQAAPPHESTPSQPDIGDEPTTGPSRASGFSYAPTNTAGNAARVVSVVHAGDVEAAVRGAVAERHGAAMPAEFVAAMATQARRTKWMLWAALAAFVVTAGVAIAQAILLSNLSADSQAQQQRVEVLMQNQQATLDSVAARLAAPPVIAVPAPVVADTETARAPASPTPRHHAARAAKAAKPAEKATARSSSKAHGQQASRQSAAKS
jgi:hypothetical protein